MLNKVVQYSENTWVTKNKKAQSAINRTGKVSSCFCKVTPWFLVDAVVVGMRQSQLLKRDSRESP